VGSLFGFFPTQTQEERNKETKPHGPGEPEIKGPEGPEQVLREQPHLEGVTRLFPENLFLISYMRFSGPPLNARRKEMKRQNVVAVARKRKNTSFPNVCPFLLFVSRVRWEMLID
jgi:hypothetical protein